jgi:transcriptional regulator with XRE-family HTH domain
MPAGTTPTLNYHGRRLLRQLRGLRLQAGLTQRQAGDRVRLEFQKLSRIENAQLPSYHELVMLLTVYGLSDDEAAVYIELWEQARKKAWWRTFGHYDNSGNLTAEDQASTMVAFDLGHLSDLLQTEDYARELHQHLTLGPGLSVEARLAVLLGRQERLYVVNERQLELHSIVHEPVLRQTCDREQLLRLIEWNKLPNVRLQVLPQSVRFHPGLAGSMVLFGFPDVDEPDQAFTSDVTCGLRPAKHGDTVLVSQALKELERLALTTRKTLQLLTKLVNEGRRAHVARGRDRGCER